MLKASALQIVIVLSLIIGMICSALVLAACYYRLGYLRAARYERLQNNLASGVNILLTPLTNNYHDQNTVDLFSNGNDSVLLGRQFWGAYDIGVARAFQQKDTLSRIFMIANEIDSGKRAALYLADHQTPLSLSGKTIITGAAYLPKSGITESYLPNTPYLGPRELILGPRRQSQKFVPALNPDRIQQFQLLLTEKSPAHYNNNMPDSMANSFLRPVIRIDFGKNVKMLKNLILSGNIILRSDTTVIIDSSASLKNILIFAKQVQVQNGFHGNCQIFARDSIITGTHCRFSYPSVLGLLQFSEAPVKSKIKISIGAGSSLNGIVFIYQKNTDGKNERISLGNQTQVNGQIYTAGAVRFTQANEIHGSIYAGSLINQYQGRLYEGYLIGTKIDATALSKYYLSSSLMPATSPTQKILQWLETK